MNEQTFNELYAVYCNLLTKSSYEEVIEYLTSLGIEYEFTHNYDNPDPIFKGVTKVTLRKDDTELSLNSTDDIFHEKAWR